MNKLDRILGLILALLVVGAAVTTVYSFVKILEAGIEWIEVVKELADEKE